MNTLLLWHVWQLRMSRNSELTLQASGPELQKLEAMRPEQQKLEELRQMGMESVPLLMSEVEAHDAAHLEDCQDL